MKKRPIYDADPVGTAEEHQSRCACRQCAVEDRHEKWGAWQMMLFPATQQENEEMVGKQPCAVVGCTFQANAGQLMCNGHWYDTPLALRRAVNATWRNYKNNSPAYWDARADAIAFHTAKEDPATQEEMF